MRQRKAAAWICSAMLMARAGASDFDVKTLEQLGYSADIAEFFSTARFLPGVHRVMLEVNAAHIYQEDVRFSQEGNLCLDAQLAETLHLKITSPIGSCELIESRWPQAYVKVYPGTFKVEITLPETAFDPDKLRTEQQGGYAVLMNYDLYGSRVQGSYGKQQTLQAMLEPGVNFQNWVIRNRSTYSKSEMGDRLDIYETSATRDFPQWDAFVQVGEFGTGGLLSGGLPITGVELSSIDRRRKGATLAVPLQGSVSSQSTLEVKQRGQVIYRTLLSAGPFVVTSLGPAIAGLDTEVNITDAEGRQQRYTVTPENDGEINGQNGYQLAAGKYRSYVSREDTQLPALLVGEKNFSVGNNIQTAIGGIVSSSYQRLAWRSSFSNEQSNWLSGGVVYSRGRQQGAQLDARGQVNFQPAISMALTSQYRTGGFRDSDQSLSVSRSKKDDNKMVRLRYAGGLSVSWRSVTLGALTYSLSHERYYHDNRHSWVHSLAYGRSLGSTMLNLNLQSSSQDRAALYAGISIPFGSGSLSSRMQRRQSKDISLGNRWQGVVGQDLNGSADIVRDNEGIYQASASLSGNTPYMRLSAGVAHSGQDSRSMSLSSSGAMGVANGTWVNAPQHVGDTLAIIKVPGQSGVKINGAGNSVTDFSGDALMPSVAPYTPLKAQIDTLTLPLNMRLDSTDVTFELARGSVGERQLRVTEVRQLLLTVKDQQGVSLATGSSVHDEQGQFIGTLIGDGNLMLINDDIDKKLRVRRINMNECQLRYEVPAVFEPTVLYEEREAICL